MSKFKLVYNPVAGKADEVKSFLHVAAGVLASIALTGGNALLVAQRSVYLEDTAAANGDELTAVGLVRQDTLAASTSTDGDYGNFKSNNLGELYVHDTSAIAAIGTGNASLASILADLDALSKAEDAAHVSGDKGIMALAIRNDGALTTLTSANGDYSGVAVDAKGRQYVIASTQVAGTLVTGSKTVDDTVGGTAIYTAPAGQVMVSVQNNGDVPVAIGPALLTYDGVDLTNGYLIGAGGEKDIMVSEATPLFAICNTGESTQVRFMPLSA